MFINKEEFVENLKEHAQKTFGKDFEKCGRREKYYALASLIDSRARRIRNESNNRFIQENKKRVYYFSMEFLIGKLLDNYLINLGIRDIVAEGLADLGEDLDSLSELEKDPGLGNGGLGRLAACFMDSFAALGYPGNGNGIRYRYGLFKQVIEGGKQVEKADDWLNSKYPWERRRDEDSVVVTFGGTVEKTYDGENMHYTWQGGEKILAVPYDIAILGYGGTTANTLRLWSAEPYEEKFDMDAFNAGDYSGAQKYRADIEAITSILYPDDNGDIGKRLRLKQEYLFVAAGIANIISSFKKECGGDWSLFADRVAIHTNDTHPSLCAPELIRVLVDEEGLDWDEAWDIAVNSISYTNHTILPEASEQWPIDMFRKLLPRVYDFVEEIDRRYRESFPKDIDNWQEKLKNTAILWDGQVKMCNLSVIAGHSVNGVARIHSDILKTRVLKDFYDLMPEKFNNKTNGVSHRRFLIQSNPGLTAAINERIGTDWIKDPMLLEELMKYKDDPGFKADVEKSKRENKVRLAQYVKDNTGMIIDPDSVFDIQVKRFHAYKRQLLNTLKIMDIYNRLKDDPGMDMRPVSFIFSGKAAQGYAFAKDCIRLIHSLAYVINNDESVNKKINIAFIPNFSVSNAQLIYPAADISEQISTAGMEASGTGNMKFMMNGALTLGTLDGSTVEIAERVGPENIKIFGLKTEEIEELKRTNSYMAYELYSSDAALKRVIDQLVDGTYDELSGSFNRVYDSVIRNDDFFVLKDFDSYTKAFAELLDLYGDRDKWLESSIVNTAKSGFFSSDRTIEEYVRDIWRI